MALVFKLLSAAFIEDIEEQLNKFAKEHESDIRRDNLIYVNHNQAVTPSNVHNTVLLCWEEDGTNMRYNYPYGQTNPSSLEGKNISSIEEYEEMIKEGQLKKEAAVVETLDKLIFTGDCTDRTVLFDLFNNVEGISHPWLKYLIDEKVKEKEYQNTNTDYRKNESG